MIINLLSEAIILATMIATTAFLFLAWKHTTLAIKADNENSQIYNRIDRFVCSVAMVIFIIILLKIKDATELSLRLLRQLFS